MSGSTPRASARSTVKSWKRTMSTTGWRVGDEGCLAADLSQRRHEAVRAFCGAAFALEHEAAHLFVDRGQVSVQDLLRMVCLDGDVGTLTELERSFLRGRPVAARAGDEPALVLRDRLVFRLQLGRHCVRQPGDVLAQRARRARQLRTYSSPCGSSSSPAPASPRSPLPRTPRSALRPCP